MTEQNIERGAAEDGADSPLTPTEVEASRTPPSQSSSDPQSSAPGERDEAESASGTDV